MMSRLLSLTLLLSAACASPTPSPNWDGEMSLALSARGRSLAEQGDRPAGGRLAREALTLARACGSLAAQAQAQALMAWIDRSYTRAEESLRLMEDGDASQTDLWDLRLLLATLALEQPAESDPEQQRWARLALDHSQRVIEEASAREDLALRARKEGAARHLAAKALRRLGEQHRAAFQERQAALVLTLLPDDALPVLRLEVFQGRGDDLARDGEFEAAFQQHMQAQALARDLGDQHAELAAMAGRSSDLAGLGRLTDAAQTASTLAELALSRGARILARDSAQRALSWLDAKDPFGHKPLRLSLLSCLRAIDAADQEQASDHPDHQLPSGSPGSLQP